MVRMTGTIILNNCTVVVVVVFDDDVDVDDTDWKDNCTVVNDDNDD